MWWEVTLSGLILSRVWLHVLQSNVFRMRLWSLKKFHWSSLLSSCRSRWKMLSLAPGSWHHVNWWSQDAIRSYYSHNPYIVSNPFLTHISVIYIVLNVDVTTKHCHIKLSKYRQLSLYLHWLLSIFWRIRNCNFFMPLLLSSLLSSAT